MPDLIDEHLVAYLLRYTSIGDKGIQRSRISRLKRLADAVGKIIEAENGSTS